MQLFEFKIILIVFIAYVSLLVFFAEADFSSTNQSFRDLFNMQFSDIKHIKIRRYIDKILSLSKLKLWCFHANLSICCENSAEQP